MEGVRRERNRRDVANDLLRGRLLGKSCGRASHFPNVAPA